MPSPDSISIESGPFSARLSPAWGGRVTHLTHADVGDILVPTSDQMFDPFNWPRAGAYPLFPFHNRVYGASFIHDDVKYHLLPHPALGGDTMHGPAHRRAWRISTQSADCAVLTLDYEADADWPFAFRAEQAFSLDQNGLTLELMLTNRADVPAPAAIGWHPYFAATLDLEARTDAELEYPLDALNVPTGQPPIPRSTQLIPATTGYTLHFSRWTNAQIQLNDGCSLMLKADAVLHHIAVHRTEGYLCLEPVSMVAGALHLPEDQRAGVGLKVLLPGESLSGRVRLGIIPASGKAESR